MNLGARWLRDGAEGSKAWEEGDSKSKQVATVSCSDKEVARFIEVGGKITEISADVTVIKVVQKNQENGLEDNKLINQLEKHWERENFETRHLYWILNEDVWIMKILW